MNILESIKDRHLFGSLFKKPETWAAWMVFLKAVFALPMDTQELELYRKYTGREKPPTKPFKEIFAIVGRRGGKSFIAAIVACFLALFHDWRPYLAPGEVAWIMVIAVDRAQARNILGYIKGILQASHMFKGMVEKDLAWEINLSNQVSLKIATADYRSLRGYTVAGVILDELAYFRSEGSNPAAEILTALRPSLATIPDSLLLGISSPYSKSGPLFEAFREKYGQDDEDVLIFRAPTTVMNPTISQKIIDKALKEDYIAGKAEWLAEFREDLEAYLTTEMLEAVVIPDRRELPRIDGVNYRAFTDPSGSGSHGDSFTLAITHKDNAGRVILDRLEETVPPFKPEDVVAKYAQILKTYGISNVQGDRYAGSWPSSCFESNSISYLSSELNKSEIYLEFAPMVAQGKIELLDNKKLFSQLRGLERRTRSGGKDIVDHYPGGKDDLSNAVAGACVLCTAGPSVGWASSADDEDEEQKPGLDGSRDSKTLSPAQLAALLKSGLEGP